MKDLRYAAEAAVPVLGTPARKLAAAAQELQEVLGGLHDAVVAEAWLRRGGTSGAPSQALVAGQLIERERRRQAACRAAWPEVWRKTATKRLRAWIGADTARPQPRKELRAFVIRRRRRGRKVALVTLGSPVNEGRLV